MRPSPSESATLFDIGTVRVGNDGNKYRVVATKNGVRRWAVHKAGLPPPPPANAKALRLYVAVLTLLEEATAATDGARIRKIVASKAFREYVAEALMYAGYEVISLTPGEIAHGKTIAIDLTVRGYSEMARRRDLEAEADLESWLRRASQAGGFECGRKLRVACDGARTVLVPAGARIENRVVTTQLRIHEPSLLKQIFAPARYKRERSRIKLWNGMRVWDGQSEYVLMLSTQRKSPYTGISGSICAA